MKKMNNKGFSLVELIVVVAIMAVLMAVLVPTLIRNVEKTRVQKDKSAIAEIHHAIELAIADEEYLNAVPSTSGASVSGGVITVANLFANNSQISGDTDGTELGQEVANTVGATVKLTSKLKNSCTITIAELDTAAGKVVMQVTTTKATSGVDSFYIDSTGENAGSYQAQQQSSQQQGN